MSEGDVLYSDVKFTRESGKPTATTSSPADTTYSEVNFLKKLPITELSGSQQQLESKERTRFPCERVAIGLLSILLVAAAIAFSMIVYKNIQIKERLQQLQGELDALGNLTGGVHRHSSSTPDAQEEKHCEVTSCNNTMPEKCPQPPVVTNDSCPNCKEGWEQHGEKCYYFSSHKLPWNKSRGECKHRGGDLVKIESEAEQKFLMRKLREIMVYDDDKFWIGMTDSVEEKKWLWVDGSPMENSSTFWYPNEPDNWDGENKLDGEDCAGIGARNRPVLNSWFDRDCRAPQNSICAEPARTRQLKCV